ncbi:MAG: UDP-N-acetylglucosamine 1-carboxyvinyltransferase [Clostridia bacterium]|nr:UDP-N-acetylglucosamine 1-carboxyvinyltransferase [Clostridia bacterium]
MEKFVVNGNKKLCGEVEISGAKNAAVAIIPATILAKGPCRIENVPNISDVAIFVEILYKLGAQVRYIDKTTIEIDSSKILYPVVPYELARKMRASSYLIGALLGRFSRAKVAMPGGCDFGVRPIDQHIKGFEALSASISVEHGMVEAHARRLIGDTIYLDVVSVGATVNIMLASTMAEGVTIIENAAREPHIVDLANFLNTMGADIRGAGTDVIKVHGVESLHGGTYTIIPDQIEAGTFMAAAAATGGDVFIKNIIPKHLESISAKLEEMGVEIEEFDDAVRVRRTGPLLRANVKTMPHPGFPTDMQPQMAVLLSLAEGTSIITEGVWDNRYRYVDELKRMGANVQVDGKIAVIEGVGSLTAAPVRATDLRAGAALMIAALAAHGTTEIEDIEHIDRGYEDVDLKLRALGADIRRIHTPESVLTKAMSNGTTA